MSRHRRLAFASNERTAAELSAEVQAYVEQRLAAALEWYRGCDVCEETLENVRRDLDRVMADARMRFRMARLPFLLRTRFEGAEIVVSAITRDVS